MYRVTSKGQRYCAELGEDFKSLGQPEREYWVLLIMIGTGNKNLLKYLVETSKMFDEEWRNRFLESRIKDLDELEDRGYIEEV